jgi:general nucleoside transport system ATP-binding protein
VIETSTGGREIVLRLNGISKRFGSVLANDGISLDLGRGEILGLLGENGAGKTTLMNILFGHYVADAGSIEVFGKILPSGEPKAALAAGIGMVHQHFILAENLTVLDNIVLGTESLWRVSSASAKARRRILELGEEFGLKVNPDAVVSTLSVGEKQRIEILKALYRDAHILILDEPTAVLTPQESEALFDTLKRFVAKGLSIVFISHKLNEILSACNRVTVLRGGKHVAEREVSGATREELAELMVGRNVPKPSAEPLQQDRSILQLKSAFARRGHQQLQNINLSVHSQEIVGIAGVSGNGQSLLADVISGVLALSSGSMTVDDTVQTNTSPRHMVDLGIARIPEDRHAEGLVGDMSIMENLIAERLHSDDFSKRGIIDWQKAKASAETIIKSYEVKCPGSSARAGLLSGGNMQKLILGRVMTNAPKLVLANQPTRGLDVGAVAYVHEQLLAARGRGAGVLLISEDLDELLALSDRVCVMFQGKLSPPTPRAGVSIQNLGLMMAGQGLKHAA